MKHRRPVRTLVVLAGLAALVGALFTSGPAAAATETETFGFTGAPEAWVVPDGVTEVEVTACGAQGGDSASVTLEGDGPSEAGGLGGCTTAMLSVTPGETLTVVVGGQGSASATATSTIDGTNANADSEPGFNGGAFGGTAVGIAISNDDCRTARSASAAAGGGGGGASDVRQGGDSPTERVLVGGGGGGAGSAGAHQVDSDDTICPVPVAAPPAPEVLTDSDSGTGSSHARIDANGQAAGAESAAEVTTFADGGDGGTGGGTAGGNGDDGTASVGSGGTGGTDSAPGTGGASGGQNGTDEVGGSGGADAAADGAGGSPTTATTAASAGGGGAGGWFGGGGGGAGLATSLLANGSGGAGGGSGFGPSGAAFEQGVQAGDGVVTITYELPEPEPDVVTPVAGRPTFAG